MQKTIFFDLEDTLWRANHSVLKPAWERLPRAYKNLFDKKLDFD